MANRCMLFAARAVPGATGETVPVLALGEFGWGIPTLYKLLVSVKPQLCRSVVFGHDGPLAIAGDRQGGLDLLKTLRANIAKDAPAAASLDEAIAYLGKAHIDHPYFLLEPGEILALESPPLDPRIRALMTEVESLRMETLTALAKKSGDAHDWATDSWSSILYFEPKGSERPPVDPAETFLSTSVSHVLTQRAALSRTQALENVHMTIDGNEEDLAAALTALGDIPGPFELTLSGPLERLPESIATLKNVTTLGLGLLGLRSLPEALAGLPALRNLYLQTNYLQSVPDVLRKMPNLKVLSLRQNALREIPAWIGELKSLEALFLDECDLRAVPKELWNLPNLKSLNLLMNPRLGRIPPGIEGLSALEDLNLADCGLDAMPEGICKLPRLKELFIGLNKIASLPDCLYGMRLNTLSLGGNPLRKPSWFSLWPARRFRAKKVYWN